MDERFRSPISASAGGFERFYQKPLEICKCVSLRKTEVGKLQSSGDEKHSNILALAGPRQPADRLFDVLAALRRAFLSEGSTSQSNLAFAGLFNPARLVRWPLTVPMCAPIGDGAAAAILCSGDYLKRLQRPRSVRVRSSILGSGTNRPISDIEKVIAVRISRLAYDKAGVGPDEIHVAEVHDATAFGELHMTEALGFCPMGEGGPFAESGATRLGGKIPINTSGGPESRGHPIGASGLGQINELVTQLRHEAGERQVENCRFALAENGGGNLGFEEAVMCIHILERVP
jgi:acetyl-CoA acetyltransferase